MSASDGHDSGQKPPRTREMHMGRERSLMGSPDRHTSDDPGLSARVSDPATAQGCERQWAEEKLSTSEKSSLPLDTAEKNNIIEAEVKLGDGDLEQKSKTSLAGMMLNFPDGGLWAWLSLSGATMIAFSTFGKLHSDAKSGLTNTWGVFETYYATHQLSSSSPSEIAWIGSFQLFCMFFGGMISGRLFDSYGPKWLLRVGSAMHFLAFILLPECKVYWQFFLCQGVLFGLGIATMYVISGC
jgi:hypothetical protein